MEDAYGDVRTTVGGAFDGTAQAVSGGAASLVQAGRDALARGLALLRRATAAPREPRALAERRLAGPHAIPQIVSRADWS